MKMPFKVLGLSIVLSLAAQAYAAVPTYNFDLIYNGNTSSLNAGSDTPVGTNLAVGDDFSYQLRADTNDYWQVNSGGDFFPFLAFSTNDSGTRTADIYLNLYLDGVLQFSLSQLGITNSLVHIGTNTVTLPTALQFDEVQLNYGLLTSDNGNNLISNIAWPTGVPFSWFSEIAYVDNAGTVSEPATFALLSLGLLGAGLARRRQGK